MKCYEADVEGVILQKGSNMTQRNLPNLRLQADFG